MDTISPPASMSIGNRNLIVGGVLEQTTQRGVSLGQIDITSMCYAARMSVSLVARQYGIGSNQISTWRRFMAQGALTAAAAGEEVVPASDYRALEAQVRELHRLVS